MDIEWDPGAAFLVGLIPKVRYCLEAAILGTLVEGQAATLACPEHVRSNRVFMLIILLERGLVRHLAQLFIEDVEV